MKNKFYFNLAIFFSCVILILAVFLIYLVNQYAKQPSVKNISTVTPSAVPATSSLINDAPKTDEQKPPDSNEEKTYILAFGDIMLARNVEAKMEKLGKSYPFEKIFPFIQEAKSHFVFANLEGPIMEKYIKINTGSTTFSFPASTSGLLKENGINIVSIANNHMLDHGQNGFDQTRERLADSKVNFFGSPKQISEDRVYSEKIDGKNFIFIGFNAAVTGLDEKKALEIIENYQKNNENFIIISIHWGDEYKLTSNDWQKKFAREMIDKGADIILGGHPHVVQEIEKYKDKMIFYSLGNFIFDQYFSKETQEGLGVKISINDNDLKFVLIPIQSILSQPTIMEGDQKTSWLKNLASRSDSKLENEIEQGEIRSATIN